MTENQFMPAFETKIKASMQKALDEGVQAGEIKREDAAAMRRVFLSPHGIKMIAEGLISDLSEVYSPKYRQFVTQVGHKKRMFVPVQNKKYEDFSICFLY